MFPRKLRMLCLCLALSLVIAPVEQAMAQSIGAAAAGAVTLPIVGTVVNAGTNDTVGFFNGTFTINSFTAANVANQVMAVGVVRGVITTPLGGVLKSGLQSISIPAVLGLLSAIDYKAPPSGGPRLMPASLMTTGTTASSGRFRLAQFGSCGALRVTMGGGAAVNIMGYNVTLSPIGVDVAASTSGLVCQILGLLGGLTDVTPLLNSLLGTLTGLLGGATGGLLGGIL